MRELPILFSGAMVRALLDGRKTQTRRIAKGVVAAHAVTGEALRELDSAGPRVKCPYGAPGDRLWVRETLAPTRDQHGHVVDWHYAADKTKVVRDPSLNALFNDGMAFAHLARMSVPSIHMPRWASRITLEVTGVRVERLHDITDADALAEGVDRTNTSIPGYARERFIRLWTSINGNESWTADPWVWIVEFKRIAR